MFYLYFADSRVERLLKTLDRSEREDFGGYLGETLQNQSILGYNKLFKRGMLDLAQDWVKITSAPQKQ